MQNENFNSYRFVDRLTTAELKKRANDLATDFQQVKYVMGDELNTENEDHLAALHLLAAQSKRTILSLRQSRFEKLKIYRDLKVGEEDCIRMMLDRCASVSNVDACHLRSRLACVMAAQGDGYFQYVDLARVAKWTRALKQRDTSASASTAADVHEFIRDLDPGEMGSRLHTVPRVLIAAEMIEVREVSDVEKQLINVKRNNDFKSVFNGLSELLKGLQKVPEKGELVKDLKFYLGSQVQQAALAAAAAKKEKPPKEEQKPWWANQGWGNSSSWKPGGKWKDQKDWKEKDADDKSGKDAKQP